MDSKYRSEIARRTADDLEHSRSCGLLLQCLGKIVSALAQFVEQPGVLDGDDCLRGESFNQFDLLIREWANLLAVNYDDPIRSSFSASGRTSVLRAPASWTTGFALLLLVWSTLCKSAICTQHLVESGWPERRVEQTRRAVAIPGRERLEHRPWPLRETHHLRNSARCQILLRRCEWHSRVWLGTQVQVRRARTR